MRAVLLKQLIFDLAMAMDHTQVLADLSTLDAAFGRKIVSAIGRAYAERYETPFPWPESIQGATKALTGGKFAYSLIDYADWWEAWSADPRPTASTAAPISTRADADGIWPVTSAGSVFVLWRRAAPKLAYLPVVGGTTYAVGAVVYDNTTGDCYENLVSAAGSTIADATKWRRLELMAMLAEATLLQAQGNLAEAAGETDRADRLHKRSQSKVEKEFTKAFETGRYGAWWANETP